MNDHDTLVLHRRIRTPDEASLHCRELDLRLDADGRHLLLNRYTELYRDDRSTWGVRRQHRIPLTSLLRWAASQANGS